MMGPAHSNWTMAKWLKIFFVFVFGGPSAFGQLGDRKGEEQLPLPPQLKAPPAPPLSPLDALQSFQIADGFHIELVACEPMVQDPVAISFDEDGRLWVVEMRGFMPTLDGGGETEPAGRISVLEDTDGDGRMDKSTVFLDKLVMPRAIAIVKGGALIRSEERRVGKDGRFEGQAW